MNKYSQVRTFYEKADVRITNWMAKYSLSALRFGLGLIFVWFGALKFVPGLSPAEDLVRNTIYFFDPDIFLPILKLVDKPARSYHTFYVWTQRLGYVPMAVENPEDAVINSDLAIIINPVKHFTREKKDQLSDYIYRGGKLFIMDNAYNRK